MAKQARPRIVRTAEELRAAADPWRQAGQKIAMVPTMGALHRAHMTLVEQAQGLAERVLVSIFLNPKQFGPGEDFEKYPRSNDHDLEMLEAAAVDLVFMPAVEEMFPPGFATDIPAGPLAEVLCGRTRPGHFDGVVTVVAELFRKCEPDLALFGEKDFQQLRVIRHLVESRDIPVEIVGAPLVRDPDGIATSSRNAYLSDDQRRQVLNLPGTLAMLTARAAEGEPLRELEVAGTAALGAAGLGVEYLEFRHEHNLELADDLFRPLRLFAAVRIGITRLIDNMPVPGG
jgi:pantoate--beta-alanine ligase